jgi:3-hydroxybutyryl-CoA dehydrogenase
VSQRAQTAPSDGPPSRAGATDERLGIAGSGTVSCGLAACAACHGVEVLIWARSAESEQRARGRVAAACAELEQTEAARLVRITQKLSDLSEATIAVEAVAEEEAAKRQILSALNDCAGSNSIVATTTSSLAISGLAETCDQPSRFFGLHVFNPVHRMRLVELCFPPAVGDRTRARAAAFCEAIGKTAVEVPDEAGFVVNRLLFPYLFDAVRLLERSGLEPRQIDACMKLGASHPMGPLELLDLVGIDVAEAIGEALFADSGEAAHRPPERIKKLVREGRLGRKSGAGFYSYPS